MTARMRGIRQTGRPRRRCIDEFEEHMKLMGMGNRHRVVTPEGMEEEFIGSQDPRRIRVLEEEEEEQEEEEKEKKKRRRRRRKKKKKKKKNNKNCFVIGLMSSFCSF